MAIYSGILRLVIITYGYKEVSRNKQLERPVTEDLLAGLFVHIFHSFVYYYVIALWRNKRRILLNYN